MQRSLSSRCLFIFVVILYAFFLDQNNQHTATAMPSPSYFDEEGLLEQGEDAWINNTFAVYDIDPKDGGISKSEWDAACRRLILEIAQNIPDYEPSADFVDERCGDAHLTQIWGRYDANGDGRVTYDEYVKYSKHQLRVQEQQQQEHNMMAHQEAEEHLQQNGL